MSRNLELSARNKQLQDTLRELTVQYNKEKEQEQNIDPEARNLRSTRSKNKEKRAQRKVSFLGSDVVRISVDSLALQETVR